MAFFQELLYYLIKPEENRQAKGIKDKLKSVRGLDMELHKNQKFTVTAYTTDGEEHTSQPLNLPELNSYIEIHHCLPVSTDDLANKNKVIAKNKNRELLEAGYFLVIEKETLTREDRFEPYSHPIEITNSDGDVLAVAVFNVESLEEQGDHEETYQLRCSAQFKHFSQSVPHDDFMYIHSLLAEEIDATFDQGNCGCEHDCCGCYFGGASALRVGGAGTFLFTATYSRNY